MEVKFINLDIGDLVIKDKQHTKLLPTIPNVSFSLYPYYIYIKKGYFISIFKRKFNSFKHALNYYFIFSS